MCFFFWLLHSNEVGVTKPVETNATLIFFFFFSLSRQWDDVFCWYWNFPSEIFPCPHNERQTPSTVIPHIVIPESHLYLWEQVKDLKTVSISWELRLQHKVDRASLLIWNNPTRVSDNNKSLILWLQMAETLGALEEAVHLLFKQFKI